MVTQETPAGSGNQRTRYLKIENITKKFGDFVALRDISLDIYKGEFICFLGPSGCGKTTLLRAIAGLDIQTSGRIEQGGKDISNLPAAERNFGIVFQSYALFPNLTVSKNVGYGLVNRRMGKAAIGERVAELLDLVGLSDQGSKYPAQLSGGEQQRVALARALATSPGLLLLDEPLSALDAKVRVFLRQEIKALHLRLGVTTIMVTHDQEEALTMADRIVVMNQGTIEQVGTPTEIYRNPMNRCVGDFVGIMNCLSGVVTGAASVRVGAMEFDCSNGVGGLTEGQAVTVCLRPEEIAVRGVASGGANSFEARISRLEFLGSFYRATLEAERLGDMKITADFSINEVRDLTLDEGATIQIALPGEHIRIFAEA